jgi:glycosyltransferase involved in cell wall biosynthesis
VLVSDMNQEPIYTVTLDVTTNLIGLADISLPGFQFEVHPIRRPGGGFWARLAAARSVLNCDYALVNCSPADVLDLCLAKLLFPSLRGRIVAMDTVLPVPYVRTAVDWLKLGVKRLLFRQCHLFIEYFRDTRGYQRYYGMPASRFRYVPFKINRYEQVLCATTYDSGYIFCGGNTRRDFSTLIEAVRGLPIPVKIVTMSEKLIAAHGSTLDTGNLPPNVEVVRHDGGDDFIDYIAGARLVVLPIKRENISASGIGVCLASMALGKCMVISEGPAVTGVIPPGAAIVVPPENSQALRAAILRVHEDNLLRQTVAASGKAYALGLGGEEQLCRSVARVLADDWEAARHSGPRYGRSNRGT